MFGVFYRGFYEGGGGVYPESFVRGGLSRGVLSGAFCSGVFCPGELCPGGGGVCLGDLSGVFSTGGFCPAGYCPGGFVRGVLSGEGFVLESLYKCYYNNH